MLIKYFSIAAVVVVFAVAAFVFVSNLTMRQQGHVVITDADIVAPTLASAADIAMASQTAEDADVDQIFPGSAEHEGNRLLGDLSTISVNVDGYGNKTETRVFRSHPRLSQVLVKTSSDGKRVAFVYGHYGDVRMIDGKRSEIALTGSGDEIANLAQIFETRLDKDRRMAPRVVQPADEPEITEEPTLRIADSAGDDASDKDNEAVKDSKSLDG
ncbi:MAG: hypothetical protein J5I65_16095 [Aridibacter famidurans]|nr:hypothetical protein [Aridibacter famidurans]